MVHCLKGKIIAIDFFLEMLLQAEDNCAIVQNRP